MELIRIGEGSLKVTLTEEDMARYALDDAAADCDSAGTRRAVYAVGDLSTTLEMTVVYAWFTMSFRPE